MAWYRTWKIFQWFLCAKVLNVAAAAKSLQSCPTLCDLIDGRPSGSPIPGILQARTLEWVAISFSNAWKWKVKVNSLSRVQLLAIPWTAAYQAPPSMGFSRQEYWSGVPLPSSLNVATCGQMAQERVRAEIRVCLYENSFQFWLCFSHNISTGKTGRAQSVSFPLRQSSLVSRRFRGVFRVCGVEVQGWEASRMWGRGLALLRMCSIASDSLRPHGL